MRFDGDTHLKSTLSRKRLDPVSLGFRLDVFLDPANTDGATETLLDVVGVLTLERTGDASVALTASDSAGQDHRSDSGTAVPISLLSRDAYRGLAGTYAVTLYAADHPGDLPPIDAAGVDAALAGNLNSGVFANALAGVGNALIRPAHAGWFGWSTDAFFEGMKTLASLALPIMEIEAIWTQLGYLATDPAKFDGMELAINIVSLATYFPVLRPLQPVVRPVKALFSRIKRIGNPQFASAIGGVLGGAFERLIKTGKTDRIESLLPFLLIALEMADNWEAVEIMVKGIESDDDLWGWIEYFNLPADGWAGEGAPPALDLAAASTTRPSYASLALDLVAPRAVAAGKKKRINGKAFADNFLKAIGMAGKGLDPKDYTGAIRVFTRGLKFADLLRVRQLAKNPVTIAFAIRVYKTGTRNLSNFLAGKAGSRIAPPLVISMLAYLSSETRAGGRLDDPHIERKLAKLTAQMFADITVGKTLVEENIGGRKSLKFNGPYQAKDVVHTSSGAQGAMFHLAMTAYYTLLNELETIEVIRTVMLYRDSNAFRRKNKTAATPYERHVDIVLKDTGTGERWVELKSLQRKSKAALHEIVWDGLQTWGRAPVRRPGINEKDYEKWGYNRQFHKDRMAAQAGEAFAMRAKEASLTLRGIRDRKEADAYLDPYKKPVNRSFKWWFQKFHTRKHPKVPSLPETWSVELGSWQHNGTIKERLTEVAGKGLGKHDALSDDQLINIGVDPSNRDNDLNRGRMASFISEADAASLLIDQLRGAGFLDSVFEQAIDQYNAAVAP